MATYRLVSEATGGQLGELKLADNLRPVVPAGTRAELVALGPAGDAEWTWYDLTSPVDTPTLRAAPEPPPDPAHV